jgi:hypothetical protein
MISVMAAANIGKAWRSYQVITTIVVGGVGLIVFFCWGKYASIQSSDEADLG